MHVVCNRVKSTGITLIESNLNAVPSQENLLIFTQLTFQSNNLVQASGTLIDGFRVGLVFIESVASLGETFLVKVDESSGFGDNILANGSFIGVKTTISHRSFDTENLHGDVRSVIAGLLNQLVNYPAFLDFGHLRGGLIEAHGQFHIMKRIGLGSVKIGKNICQNFFFVSVEGDLIAMMAVNDAVNLPVVGLSQFRVCKTTKSNRMALTVFDYSVLQYPVAVGSRVDFA